MLCKICLLIYVFVTVLQRRTQAQDSGVGRNKGFFGKRGKGRSGQGKGGGRREGNPGVEEKGRWWFWGRQGVTGELERASTGNGWWWLQGRQGVTGELERVSTGND